VVLAYCYPALVLFLCKVYNNDGVSCTNHRGTKVRSTRGQAPMTYVNNILAEGRASFAGWFGDQ